MKQYGLMSLMAMATTLWGTGYKVPEQSQKGLALSSAYVANAYGADASYYNPANMAFETNNGSAELDLGFLHLSGTKFVGNVQNADLVVNDSSGAVAKKEDFLIPTFFYVSPPVNDFRFGLALVSPAGLTKSWDEQPAAIAAEEFSLMTYELNPTVSYKMADNFSIAAGIRMIYAEGIAKSTAPAPSDLSRDMKGDSLDFGYNLAVSYRPSPELKLAATYRSKIILELEGSAALSNSAYGPVSAGTYDGSASVNLPTPATLNLAVAYTFDERSTLEFVYDRAYWSEYKTLDFNYHGDTSGMSPLLIGAFDLPIDKNWKDTDTYRLGLTHEYDKDWTLMAGMVYFESPMPEQTLNFDHPDVKGWAYSAGFRHMYTDELEVGVSVMYADRDNRTVTNNNNGIDGTFSNTKVYVLTLGVEYKF